MARPAWMLLAALATCAASAACGDNLPAGHESPYWNWHGQRAVGAINVDGLDATDDTPTLDDYALAKADGSVMMLYAHIPGQTVSMELLDTVLARAQAMDMPYLTYADLAAGGEPRAGLSLSFDDDSIDAWFTLRPLLAKYDARVTFFVTRYYQFDDNGKAELHQLADDGNDIEAHTVNHEHGPDYVAQHGMAAYLADEIQPSFDILRADGYDPVALAWPFGSHTDAMDQALLPIARITRGIATVPGVTRTPAVQ